MESTGSLSLNYTPLTGLLLGAINGFFIAHSTDEEGTHLHRSEDGYTWQTYTLPQGKNIRLMAAQEWTP